MINSTDIKRTFYTAVTLLSIGIVLVMISGRLMEKGNTEEEIKPLLILATLALNGFVLASVFLWLNEFVWRWKEGNDLGDRIMPIFWLAVTNIYGAYYFSYRRMKD